MGGCQGGGAGALGRGEGDGHRLLLEVGETIAMS